MTKRATSMRRMALPRWASVCLLAEDTRGVFKTVYTRSGSTFTYTWRSRGPSNSAKKIPCHRPSASFPSSTKTNWLTPTSMVFICESELPSLWRYGPAIGTIRSSAPSASLATSGSACSLIKIAAVVCGTYRKHVPTRTPSAVTTRCTSAVMSTICVRRSVLTRMLCIVFPPQRKTPAPHLLAPQLPKLSFRAKRGICFSLRLIHHLKPVIPTEAARFFPPRRLLARRAAEWRNRCLTSTRRAIVIRVEHQLRWPFAQWPLWNRHHAVLSRLLGRGQLLQFLQPLAAPTRQKRQETQIA